MPASESIPAKSKWQGWLAKAVLFFVSLLVFMEGGARIALWINPIRRRITGFDDSSYRLQWVRLHQIHQEWTGQYATYDPTLGWTLKSNIEEMSVFNGKILNSNSKGFRGKQEYEYQRTPGKQRIIVLGDSFTFGEEVSDNETYASKLESALQNTEVLNMGVQGYGHDQMLLRLQEEGVKYHPDVVVLGFTYIDIYRNIESFFAFAKPRFRLGPDGLELTNVPVSTPEHILATEPYRPKALDILEILYQKLRWSLGQNEKEARAVTRLLLGQVASTARSIGAVPVVAYLPVYEEIQPIPKGSFLLTANSPPVANREEYLRQICQEQGIPCLFLRPRFRKEVENGANFDPERHWNAQAHGVAAQEIRNFLVTNRLIQNKSIQGDQKSDSARK